MGSQEKQRKVSVCQRGSLVGLLILVSSPLFGGTVPDTRGTWSGTTTGEVTNCQNPDLNESGSASGSFTIESQTGSTFMGTATQTESGPGVEASQTTNFSATISPDGKFTGSGTYMRTINDAFFSSGTLVFNGMGD